MEYLIVSGAELRAAGYDVPDGWWLVVLQENSEAQYFQF